MKKILSLVLVAAMLASMLVFVPAAGAAEVPTVALDSTVATAGETVTIPVKVTAGNVTAFSALIEYDGERLQYMGVEFPVTGIPVGSNGDPVYNEWYDNGSFVSFSWTTENPVSASEGLVLANITFTVKDTAALGAAYVAVRDYGAVNAAGNTIYGTLVEDEAGVHQGAGNVACVDGGVVVVDAAWTSFSDEADFVIEDGVLTEYLGDADVVIIPTSVTFVAERAFGDTGTAVKQLILPANVAELDFGAFVNCSDLEAVYIYNADIVLGDGCLGWEGTVKRGKLTLSDIAYTDKSYTKAMLTIYSVASENVAEYAVLGNDLPADDDEYVPFVNEVVEAKYALTFNGATYLAPANTKAPGQMTIDGETVVAWQNGDAVVAAGADLVLTAAAALEPITIKKPVTSTVAAIKANADVQKAGLRFTATLDIADYEALAALGTVELGMLVTPAAYVAKAGAFTKTALDAIKKTNATYVDIALGGYFEKTETEYTFAAQLTNFSASTYKNNFNFVAVMYATVTINGVATTVYGAYNWEGVQNVKDLAIAGQTAAGATDTVKGQLAALVAKFN